MLSVEGVGLGEVKLYWLGDVDSIVGEKEGT